MKELPDTVKRAIDFHVCRFAKPGQDLYDDLYNNAVIHVLEAVEKGLDLEREGVISYLNKRLPGRLFSDWRKLTSAVTLSNTLAATPARSTPEVHYEVEEDEESGEFSPEMKAAVREAVKKLDPVQQQVVMLMAVEGQNDWYVADKLGLKPREVLEAYYDGLDALEEMLK